MLYIEKGPCPEEVQQKISQLKAQKEWQDIPGDFSGLSEEERHSYMTVTGLLESVNQRISKYSREIWMKFFF